MAPPDGHTQSIKTKTESYDVTGATTSVIGPVPSHLLSSLIGVGKSSHNSNTIHNVSSSSEAHSESVEEDTSGTFNISIAAVTQAVSQELQQIPRRSDGTIHLEDIMGEHYSNVQGNLTSPVWYNYTCMYSFQVPDDFFKNVLEPAICGCGIVGIILTMIVLSRKTMVTSTNCYLTALAVGDLFYLLLLLSRIIIDKIDDCDFQVGNVKSIYSHFVSIFMDVSINTTIGVTVMLAVERYIAICQPMQAMTLCSVKRARVIIVIIAIVAFILITPRFTDVTIEYHTVKPHNETRLILTWNFRYNEQVYVIIVKALIVTILPICCLLAFNIRLIIEIRRSTRYLQVCLGAADRSVVTQEELKITIMLISVVIVFFICQAPFMVWNMLVSLYRYEVMEYKEFFATDPALVLTHTVQCMLAIKSSCNFILYCWFSEKFWITFKRLFCLSHCLPSQGIHRANGCSNNNSNNNHHRPSCYITRETTC